LTGALEFVGERVHLLGVNDFHLAQTCHFGILLKEPTKSDLNSAQSPNRARSPNLAIYRYPSMTL
jgi:hypothetical protein